MSNLYVLGLTGHMGAGKSTVTHMLQEKSGIPVVTVKLAAPIYDIQEAIYDIISPVYTRPADFVKDRTLLQWIGTEWGRNRISDTLWTDLWITRVLAIKQSMGNKPVIVVADDVRFPNEIAAIKSFEGMVVKIENHRGVKGGIRNHPSEKALAGVANDYTIDNTGTMKQLENEVEKFMINTGLTFKK